MQYNAATRGLFRDLLRHLDRAWARHSRRGPVRRRRVAGGAAGPARQRLPALARYPGDDRLPGDRTALAARDRQGLGPHHPPLSAAAARDAARLPGRLARPGHRRAHRARRSRGRGLHPHPRRDQHAAASRRKPVLGQPPQPDDLPVLPGHRVRPGQRADGRGARAVPPRDPAPGPRRPQRGRAGQGPARDGDPPARRPPAPARPGRAGRVDPRRRPAADAPGRSTRSCATPAGAPARSSACAPAASRSSAASTT